MLGPLRLLIVEDSDDDGLLLVHELKRAGYQLDSERVDTGPAMTAALDRQSWDLVVGDYNMPSFSGVGALRLLRARDPDLPFIFVSGSIGEEVAVQAMKEGAQDYLMKGNLRRLVPAVQRALKDARERSERRQAETALAAQHAVTRVLAEASGIVDAVPQILTAICGCLSWDLGVVWMADPKQMRLRCVDLWRAEHLQVREFEAISRGMSLTPGASLAGRVWSSGTPEWIPDSIREESTERGRAAVEAGLHGACAFPIRSGADVIGVMEFYSSKVRQPDAKVLEMMVATGSQIGQFVERRRAMEALSATQARLQEVLASSTAVVYSLQVTKDGFVPVWVTENITRVLGYTVRETLRPTWWTDRVHPDDQASVFAQVARRSGQEEVSLEYRFRHKDGVYRWIHDQSRLLKDPEGRPLEVIGAWFDVTGQKQLENQFLQAQKMEAVGRLAGGVAHDFNNLLTIIIAHATLLLEEVGDQDQPRDDVEQIRKAANNAARLTRQLLAFSRQQVLQPQVIDLNGIVTEAEQMLKRVIGEDIVLETALDDLAGAVKADPGQIGQVVMNLAVNARDAMPQGGRLTIETRNVDVDEAYSQTHSDITPGPYVMLAMSDTGSGMDESTKARIFEPFFTTKEAGKGTGLGLATVYGIIKQSAGFVWVYSELGKGTTFKVYLPRVDSAVEAGATRPTPDALPCGTETILLVEDESALREVTRKILLRQGYTVLEASNGDVALRLAAGEQDPIHLLLTDVVMPTVSGREVATQLGRLRPEMKVLYTSGYTDDAVLRHGVLQAGVAYIQKPFTPDSMVRKVREVLDAPAPG